MKPLDAVRAMVAEALGTEPVDRYTAARARAAREKPDRMTFQPVRRARRKTAKRDQRREYVDQLREQGFDAEYLEDRYGRRR